MAAKVVPGGDETGEGEDEPKAKAKGKGKAKAKASPGESGTFAGRRPPADAKKRAHFDELKAHYLQARLEAVKSQEEVSGNKTQKPKQIRKFSDNQEKYWKSMKIRMQELANAGVAGPERMRIAAADWKAHALAQHEDDAVARPEAQAVAQPERSAGSAADRAETELW